MKTRPAAVADMFYPGNANTLRGDVDGYLAASAYRGMRPKAIIVPHAGYVYSGAVAAQAYAQLRELRDIVHRVILLGPCHRVPLRGLAVPSDDYFQTPLGKVAINTEAIASITRLPLVRVFDVTHEHEHSLEVQLPFLQQTLSRFSLVPIVVGDASAEEVSEALELLWGGDETLIVISSDLSHYHDYDTARAIDGRTCEAIENLDAKSINVNQVCGRNPLGGLLLSAQQHGLDITTLDLRNSGDTAGSKDRVVGYGAWMLHAASH